jgi:hypothetical protein
MANEPTDLVLEFVRRIDQRINRFDERLHPIERRVDLIEA